MKFLPFFLVLSPTLCLGREDFSFNPDPAQNSRPRNVTDLTYWMYGWVGSYYNGTTTFRFLPQTSEDSVDDDDEQGRVCPRFANQTISFSFDSLVTVARPDADTEGNNPVMFLLKSWVPGTSLVPSTGAGLVEQFPDQRDNLEWSLESVVPPENNDKQPRWNLTLDKRLATSMPFGFSGKPIYMKDMPMPMESMRLNMSSCDNAALTWWGASFLDLNDTKFHDMPIIDPSFRVTFDNKSASFQYTGNFLMNTDPGNNALDNGDPKMNTLLGTVSIEFLGSIDTARSDVLVERDGKPAWGAVIGFGNGTGTIDAGKGGSSAGTLGNPGLMNVLLVGAGSILILLV